MNLSCFYDYSCPYSYRALAWLDSVAAAATDIEVSWRTFSLKEANRDRETPSPFDDPEITSTSVLALALAQAAVDASFSLYHHSVFEAMHAEHRRLGETDLLTLAAKAGVDIDAFDTDRARWLRAVAEDHREAVNRFGVFGTPTLVLGNDAVVFVKLADVPRAADAAELWRSLCTLARCYPELLEIKRPVVEEPPRHS